MFFMPAFDKFNFLTQTWLKDLPDAVVRAAADAADVLQVPDGYCLFNRGDKPLAFYGVITGAVRFIRVNDAGREMILDVAAPGSFFGEISILGDKTRGYDAMCSGSSRLIVISSDAYRHLFEAHPEFRWHAVRKLCNRINVYYDSFEDAFLLKLPARIAKRIVALALAQQGCQPATSGLVLDAGLSQENLASMLGITRQSLSKQLMEWKDCQWIDIQYGRIVIFDLEALKGVSEGSGKKS
jgi:CRP/FNR family cyclic AMP-dependent transcriptional regulator